MVSATLLLFLRGFFFFFSYCVSREEMGREGKVDRPKNRSVHGGEGEKVVEGLIVYMIG